MEIGADRGAAVVLASLVERSLERLLRKHLREDGVATSLGNLPVGYAGWPIQATDLPEGYSPVEMPLRRLGRFAQLGCTCAARCFAVTLLRNKFLHFSPNVVHPRVESEFDWPDVAVILPEEFTIAAKVL